MSANPTRCKFVFCTIITENYFPFAKALYESIAEFHAESELIVLVSDRSETKSTLRRGTVNGNIKILYYDEICQDGYGKVIFGKYHLSSHDAFRWAMKPVLLLRLLAEFEKVVYTDCDVHFFHDYAFLYDLLDDWSLLLTPHYRSIDPSVDYDNYIMQFNNGIYNGGFVGVRRDAVAPLSWWARVCGEICEVNPCKGQFVDQSHLNLLPVYFDKVHVLQHRGCNVANWNQVECKRVPVNGSVKINGKYPIVFVHFTKSTVRGILAGSDAQLGPFLDKYLDRLKPYGVSLDWILPPPVRIPFYKKINPFYVARAIKHRLRRFSAEAMMLLFAVMLIRC